MILSEILDKVCQNLDIERHEGPFAVPSQEEIDPNQSGGPAILMLNESGST
jgi:hypothetical protein